MNTTEPHRAHLGLGSISFTFKSGFCSGSTNFFPTLGESQQTQQNNGAGVQSSAADDVSQQKAQQSDGAGGEQVRYLKPQREMLIQAWIAQDDSFGELFLPWT